MLNFPSSTIFGKKVPKESFYKNMEISASMKRSFVNDIGQIVWENKLSPKTTNLGKGKKVQEIEILYINLKKKKCNYSVFEFIDRNLPHYTVFVLNFKSETQLLINYKEPVENKQGKFRITTTYKTDWLPTNDVTLSIEGLNMDKVYEGFVSQVADDNLVVNEEIDLKETVEKSIEVQKIEKKIGELKNKKRKEKQFNIQLEYSNEIKKLNLRITQLKKPK